MDVLSKKKCFLRVCESDFVILFFVRAFSISFEIMPTRAVRPPRLRNVHVHQDLHKFDHQMANRA